MYRYSIIFLLSLLFIIGCDFTNMDKEAISQYLQSNGVNAKAVTADSYFRNRYIVKNGELYAIVAIEIKLPKDFKTQ